MVVTRIDGQPIAFTGQVVAYGAGILNTINERIFVDTAQRVITVANPNPEDHFYANLATGALPRRNRISPNNKIEINSTDGIYTPSV